MPVLPKPEIFGPATLVVTQGISAFQAFLPKFSEVRAAHPENNPAVAADVRMGEVAAVTVTIGMGLICSSLTGSSIPAVVSVITCGILAVLYESTLQAHDPGIPKPQTVLIDSEEFYAESVD